VDQLLTVRVYSSIRSRNCRGRSDGFPENVGNEEAGGRTIVFEAGCIGGIVGSLVVERLGLR
jgi:hypothetical protein